MSKFHQALALPLALAFAISPGALPVVAIMAGVAVIAFGFLQQVPTALGTSPGESENAFVAMLQSLPTITWPTVAWAVLAAGVVIAIMLLLPKVAPKIPGSIVGILVVTLTAEFGRIPLARIGELPTSLPPPSIPEFNLLLLPELAPPAMAVAGLAAIESLLSARVAQGLTDRGRYDGDRELVGQGLASVASGFFGGIPATGAIARTAVNVRSGAHTRIAACVHALFLAGVVLRMSQLQFLDSSGARALSEVVSVLRRRGIHVLVKGIQSRHLRLVEHTGVIQSLAKRDHLFTTLDEALAAARAIVAQERAREE